MPILSIHIVAMSILSISITKLLVHTCHDSMTVVIFCDNPELPVEIICYIKGDKVMCYIEQKSPAPAPCGRHGTRIAPLFG